MDVLNTGSAPSGAAPEGHDEAMLAKVDAANAALAGEQEPTEAPKEKLLGKFESTDDLLKAYQELERKLSGGEKTTEAPKELTQDEAAEKLQQANLDLGKYEADYLQSGGLSEESYAELEKAGIPRQMVDNYIDGLEAKANEVRSAMLEKVGGAEKFSSMAQWAAANMSEAELAAYNRAVESIDMTVVENAVLGLAYRYSQAAGRDPQLLGGQPAGAGSVFQSVAQLTAAMKDPRYETDPAYRNEVAQRLARSSIL